LPSECCAYVQQSDKKHRESLRHLANCRLLALLRRDSEPDNLCLPLVSVLW